VTLSPANTTHESTPLYCHCKQYHPDRTANQQLLYYPLATAVNPECKAVPNMLTSLSIAISALCQQHSALVSLQR
jgi:hypothetical protein